MYYLDDFYPVGSYYETSDSNFNPNVSFGGSWTLMTGRVTISTKSGSYSVGDTGGADTVKLEIANMPKHKMTATVPMLKNSTGTGTTLDGNLTSSYGRLGASQGSPFGQVTWTQESTGGSQAHNNMQPYIKVRRWRRDS